MARTDGGGVDGDGGARHLETYDLVRSMRLTTANQKGAAALALGRRSCHGDDGRRTAGGGYGESSDLRGEVQKDSVLTLEACKCSLEAGEAGRRRNRARRPAVGGGEDEPERVIGGAPARLPGGGGRGRPGEAFAPADRKSVV